MRAESPARAATPILSRGQRSEWALHLVRGLVCSTRPTVNDHPRIAPGRRISHIRFESQQKTRNQSAASLLRQNQEATAASRCFKPRKETGEEACELQQQQSDQNKTYQQFGSTQTGCPWTNQKCTIQQLKQNIWLLSLNCEGRKSVVLLERTLSCKNVLLKKKKKKGQKQMFLFYIYFTNYNVEVPASTQLWFL